MKKKSIILVTGGARSGKSTFAEEILSIIKGKVLYVATSQAFDEEMQDRINKHKLRRPSHWLTHEGHTKLYDVFSGIEKDVEGILVDCLTLMITGMLLEKWKDDFTQAEIDEMEEDITCEVRKTVDSLKFLSTTTVLVTNEIGLGIVPDNKLARVFRDIAGRINQYVAKEADEVYLVVCGIPTKLK